MRKGRFTARPKEQYQIYGETYASANTIGNWFNFGNNKENDRNINNRLSPSSQFAIQAPPNSGPIIEEVNSGDEVDDVEKLSSTMHDTTLDDHQSELLEGETYDVFDYDNGPLTSTVQRGRNDRNIVHDFFDGEPDISIILQESSTGSQLSSAPNRGVIHFDEVLSTKNSRGSKRSSQNSKGVSFIVPDVTSKRRYTPPLEINDQTPRFFRKSRSNSLGDISNHKLLHGKASNLNLENSPESEDLDYSSDEEDNFSEAEDVEVVYSENDLSDIDDDELESVREDVRKHHKDVIAKNIKFIDKLHRQKNSQISEKFSSKMAFNIPRAPFNRLVREIYQDYLVDCFKMANVVTGAREKATLYPRDMRAARKIMSIGGS
ncbi:Histone H3 family and Histone-fold domain-containing protein [Strongyloides ratti]|uniref:Histone H3 family and Histone-fold domain-containing protein n=1 Tax=Strongyloides ratti TaxID=34506 RepID=A0A090L8B4_STRRB|nr:Histone H3 family and Histone-fold domain-containing protein [Strongyloides ratti]CEF64368.1 Histone H3 family and Histone-fold domain-containing protein [Strongyloides ratti]